MKKTSIASETPHPFYIRLGSIPGEQWYLQDIEDADDTLLKRIKLPETIWNQDLLVDKINFFNKQAWYHFKYDNFEGWLPKKNVKKTFRRLAIPPLKQQTQTDLDNQVAALQMVLQSAGANLSDDEIKNQIGDWNQNDDSLADLSHIIIDATHSIKDLRRANFKQLENQIMRRRPVILKVAGVNNLKTSLIVLIGFNKKIFYYNDPWTGHLESISTTHLKKHWQNRRVEAISY
ncbi:C39 family peptidase [Lentilactobacillus sp. Marseille-Q4993]|uniref:C39 family peptidase n=1 Tax=Lentilactobacillus sp. Marseille-Q4993 TaxID=3039492 RepID=UPI0024BD3294|nr:C39 family peptidase [Lentilactobacillus sp. Marseille-Q4993]